MEIAPRIPARGSRRFAAAVAAADGGSTPEPLAILLLPCRLEDFERREHARELLKIPRVIAIEPSARRTPRFLRESLPARQVRRLRFPGEPRMLVLYHPSQYPLARALCASYDAELWYLPPGGAALEGARGYSAEELLELDQLARERAGELRLLAPTEAGAERGDELRLRMCELEIISARPFVPGARIDAQ